MDPDRITHVAKRAQIPTSLDVAAIAGVSQATVSRALRDGSAVRRETRERVKAAAKDLNYRPNRAAIQLRGARPDRIAVVLLSPPGDNRAALNPFYYDLVGSVEAEATRRNLGVMLSYQGEPGTLRCDFEQRGDAYGVIVIGSTSNREGWRFFGAARRAGANIVGWGSPDDALPTVRTDNHGGAALAVDYLVARGRTRIAFVGPGWRRHHAFRERRAGYRAALAQHGLDPIECAVPAIDSRARQGEVAIAALRLAGAACDAVFAASEGLALGVMRGLGSSGLKVPDDVSVVGFDGAWYSRDSHPALTTIEQDIASAGALLVAAIAGDFSTNDSVGRAVPLRLVARASA